VVDRRFSAPKWIAALNAHLPPTIRILRCAYARKDFHARYSAKAKIYRYRIWAGPILPPLERDRAWHVSAKLNLDLLRAAGARFVGRHDFAAFAANRGTPASSTIRTIRRVRVQKNGPCITIDFEGDGFLYKMVRLMVGAMLECARGKLSEDRLSARLNSVQTTGPRHAAPAAGLFLVRVRY
jgi:tRNA pseudouridine38-40 synthase